MNDAISRQSVIDMLDETKRIARQNIDGAVLMTFERVLDSLVNITNALPTIQPAEPQIIRCKDCKNWDTTWTNDFSPNYHYCPMVDGVRKEDWFCADAERKTE